MSKNGLRAVWLGLLLTGGFRLAAADSMLGTLTGTSPEFVVKTWQMPQGLPSDRVRVVLQTHDGYLWIATYNGVAQFDGVRFRVFNDANTPTLRNRLISCLFEDDHHRLWIGSDTGEITWRDEAGFHELAVTNKWPGFPIVRFAQSSDGTIWALNLNGFVLSVRGLEAKNLLGNEAGPLYSELLSDNDGQVWSIHYGGKVVRLSAGREVNSDDTPAPPRGFRTIAAARHGGLWIRDEDRLRRWYRGQWVEDRGTHPWGTRQGVVLFEASTGEVWVGTREDGLFMVGPDGSEHHINHATGLAHDLVSSITEDREGNLWVGSDSGGLERLRRRALYMVSPPDPWQHRPVLSVSPAVGGGIWVSAEGAGVYRLNGAQVTPLNASNTPAAKEIRTVVEDHRGRVWAGAEVRERLMSGLLVQDPSGRLSVGSQSGGLLVGSGGELRPFTNANLHIVMPSRFYAIYEDREGMVWMGSQNGLLRLAQDQWSLLGGQLYRPEVRCISETPDGALWIGMRGGGVARFHDGRFKQFLRAQGLPYDYAWALLGDRDGSVWSGTPGAGLLRYGAEHFVSFTTSQGLPSDFICSILDDDQGHLWIGSYAGIFQVAKADLERCAADLTTSVNCFLLDANDGLASLEMAGGNQPSACRTEDGRLWFATGGGLAMVDPERIRTNGLPPPVWLEEVLVDEKHLAPGPVQKQASSAPSSVRVPPGSGQLELRYTALSFCAPQRVRFRYRLDKVDPVWVEAGTRRSAYYSHLAPGDYHFRVIACNSDGVWNETGAAVALTLLPYFWQTWWFGPLCWLGGASAIGAGVLTALRRRHRARIQVLERARLLERERGRIARDLHDDLGSGLTDIGMTSALGQDASVPPEEAREYLREISQRSNEMVMALDEIVWAVNPKNDDLGSLTTYFCQFAERFVRLTPLSCRFEIPSDLPALPLNAEQRHSLFLAFKEALQNAVKHSAASNLVVNIDVENNLLKIVVEDNGRGFDPGPPQPGADGLRNMRERLEQLGGSCDMRSALGKGTRVAFTIAVTAPLQHPATLPDEPAKEPEQKATEETEAI
jgi:ligand-binding sensor domain-containing protein/signal transduction histidine kinase